MFQPWAKPSFDAGINTLDMTHLQDGQWLVFTLGEIIPPRQECAHSYLPCTSAAAPFLVAMKNNNLGTSSVTSKLSHSFLGVKLKGKRLGSAQVAQ